MCLLFSLIWTGSHTNLRKVIFVLKVISDIDVLYLVVGFKS